MNILRRKRKDENSKKRTVFYVEAVEPPFHQENILSQQIKAQQLIQKKFVESLACANAEEMFKWKFDLNDMYEHTDSSPIFRLNHWPYIFQVYWMNTTNSISLDIQFWKSSKECGQMIKTSPTVSYRLSSKLTGRSLIRVQNLKKGEKIVTNDSGECHYHVNLGYLFHLLQFASSNEKLLIGIHMSESPPVSDNGRLFWKIDNYQLKVNMIKAKTLTHIDSPTFYTSCVGYRVKIKLILNKYVFVVLCFLDGQFDNALPVSFLPTFEFSVHIVNPLSQHRELTVNRIIEWQEQCVIPLGARNLLKHNNLICCDSLFTFFTVSQLDCC